MSTSTAAPSDGDTTTATIAKGLEDRLRMFVDYGDCTSLKSLKTSEEFFAAAAQLESMGRLAAIAEGSGAFDGGVITVLREIEVLYGEGVASDREWVEKVSTTPAIEVAKWAGPGETFADVLRAGEEALATSEHDLASVRALLDEAALVGSEVPA
jgi:hypothetical protein